ncbi:MAG TPA: O-antigen ligase family protein [Verrucomicrobiae bacterium]|nr:O-antigen ligase family protein [Verrucomicrobiae bacterium]
MESRSVIRDVPDPTPWLFALAAAVACAIWFIDRGPVQVVILALAVAPAVLAFVYFLGANVYVGTVCLIAATATPRAAIAVSGVNVRPEQVLAGFLCLTLPWAWNAREGKIEWLRADWLLGSYMVINLVSSWFMSIDPKQTTRWALQQLLAIAPYFILRIVAGREETFRRAFRALLIIGAVEGLYATVAIFANKLFGAGFGLSTDQYEGMPAVYGTQFEPNILGSYCAACAVMMAVMYLKQKNRWYLIGYMLSFSGMAVSFARASVLAYMAVISLLLLGGLYKRWINWPTLRRLVLATAIVAVVLSPLLVASYVERFSTVQVTDVTADPNTFTRAVQLAIGAQQFLDHPILGNGTASFQLLFDWQSLGPDWEEQGWLGNTEVRVLHDTGIVGFGLFTGFLISLALAARKILRSMEAPELLALVAACGIYLITFQATEGTILGFSWVHLGLIGCGVAAYTASTATARVNQPSTGM